MKRWWTVIVAGVPGLVLAGAGLAHPARLRPETATAWWQFHVILLPLFPLLAVALWVLLRGANGPLAWLARAGAYGYATFYTGLDALTGIAAGLVVETTGRTSQASIDLGRLGVELGGIGEWSFLAAAVLTGFVLVRRDGLPAAPGAVVLVGAAVAFRGAHIYWPAGGLAMIGVAIGCALLAAASPRRHASDRQEGR